MRGVSRQLQTTRRERVNVGLSLTVFLTHVLSHHVVSRCFCQFELRPVVYSEDHQTEQKSGFEIVGLETIFSGSAYINGEQFQEHAVSFFET